MNRDPITRQRSPWEQYEALQLDGVPVTVWRRRIHDGALRALVADEPAGWHLSVSWAGNGPRQALRYPTWDELAHARYELLPADIGVAMYLPAELDYVAVHPTTFHLHQHPPRGVEAELKSLARHLDAANITDARAGVDRLANRLRDA